MLAEKKGNKRYITISLRLIVAFGALVLVFRNEDISELYKAFLGVNFSVLVSAYCLYFVAQLLFSLRWLLILQTQGVKISFFSALKLHLLGLFYNNCLPSSVGGDLLRGWYVTKHCAADKKFESVLSVLVDRAVGLSGMIIMAVTAYWLIPINGDRIAKKGTENKDFLFEPMFEMLFEYRFLLLGVCGTVIFLFFISMSLSSFRQKVLVLTGRLCQKGIGFFKRSLAAGKLYFSHPLNIIFAYILTFILQGMAILGMYLIGEDLGVGAHIKYYYVIFPVSWMIGSVPVSIGGMGIMEGSIKVLFSQIKGVNSTFSAVLAIFQRLIWFLGSLPGLFIHIFGGHLPSQKDNILIDEPVLKK